MTFREFQPGDRVVYRKTKHSPQPGPRAEHIVPSQGGDDYAYCVDKYWLVKERTADEKIVVLTRRGKTHTLNADDPNLRHANLWERWFLGKRFPDAEAAGQTTEEQTEATV